MFRLPSPAHSHGHVQVALGLPAANAGLLNMKGLSYCASCTLSWHIQRGSTKLSTFRSDVYLVLSRKQYFQQVLHQRAGVSVACCDKSRDNRKIFSSIPGAHCCNGFPSCKERAEIRKRLGKTMVSPKLCVPNTSTGLFF